MSDPFLAEIRPFPFNFAPKGWAFCAGQLIPLQQNTALFSLLGTNYGGDAKTTFGLPNLQGQLPVHAGGGGGPLSQWYVGEATGSETVTLLQSEIPAHAHALQGAALAGTTADPASNSLAQGAYVSGSTRGVIPMYTATTTTTSRQQMALSVAAVSGGDQPHNNMMPYLTINFCIALQGIFPPRG